MPELPVTVNANITRIDAPFPEQWREELFQFSKGLEEIKAIMTTMATSLVESKEAEEMMLKVYSAEALQARASMVQAPQVSQHREENERGERPGASTPPEAFHFPPLGGPIPSQGGGAGPAYETGGSRTEGGKETETGSTPPDAPRRRKREQTPYEENLEWLKENTPTQVAHYGGKFTFSDLFNLMAQSTKGLNGMVGEGGEESFLGRATNALTKTAHTYMPNIEAGYSWMQRGKAYSEGLGAYSGALGYEPGNGALGMNSMPGPFGTNFRIPLLNSAALSGIASTAEAYETAMSYPGLSGSQVMAMNQALAERGWFPGQKPQQELFDAQAHLISKGGVFQQLGENPATAEMLDEGARYGNSSMEELIGSIEEIPEAAKNAHEGIAQMQATMREVGEYNESIGGTKAEGQRQALMLAQTTGMPIQAVKGMIESPYTTSAIFRETGTPSWAQGSLPAGIKNEIATKEFWRLAEQVGPGESHTYKVGSFEGTKTAVEDQAARLHMINPSVSYEAALKMLREGRTGSEGRNKVASMAELWRQNADQFMGTGKTGLENELLRATTINSKKGEQNFGLLLHEMAQLKTAQGAHMFNHHDLWDIRTNEGQGYGGHGKQLVKEKYEMVQDILDRKAGKDANAAGSPGNVVIELSPQAKRLLQLPNKKSRIKLEAGAGENSTVNGSTGYSDNLTPAEASNNWSYGPGSFVGR